MSATDFVGMVFPRRFKSTVCCFTGRSFGRCWTANWAVPCPSVANTPNRWPPSPRLTSPCAPGNPVFAKLVFCSELQGNALTIDQSNSVWPMQWAQFEVLSSKVQRVATHWKIVKTPPARNLFSSNPNRIWFVNETGLTLGSFWMYSNVNK